MAEMKNVRYNMNNVSLTKTSTSKSYLRMMKFVFWCTFPKLRTKYIKKLITCSFFKVTCYMYLALIFLFKENKYSSPL